MSKTFLQYKGAWAKHLYPKKNKKHSTYTTSGCATCMLAAIISNLRPNITPEMVGDYISSIGGATQGGATYHWAIKKTAEHFEVSCKEIGTMTEFLKLMRVGTYWGGLLFDKGSRNSVRWTSGGHYIAATDIRKTDELYMRDSGMRNHIGWYSYSKYMRGLIKKAWVFWLPKKEEPKKDEPKVETKPATPKKTSTELAREGAVHFAKVLADSNVYGYKKYDSTDHMCPICHPKTKVKGFNCIGLVAACYGHGAGDKTIFANCNKNNGSALGNNVTLTEVTLESWRKKNGANWDMITNGGKKNGASISASKLLAGDILIGYDTKGKYKHTMIYIGNGKLIDAISSGAKANQIAERSYTTRTKSMRITRAFRYTGKGKF